MDRRINKLNAYFLFLRIFLFFVTSAMFSFLSLLRYHFSFLFAPSQERFEAVSLLFETVMSLWPCSLPSPSFLSETGVSLPLLLSV